MFDEVRDQLQERSELGADIQILSGIEGEPEQIGFVLKALAG